MYTASRPPSNASRRTPSSSRLRNVSFMFHLSPSWGISWLRAGYRWIQQKYQQSALGKQLQRFLGFANFYCRFIHNYSSITAPLTALTSSKVPFLWTF